MSISSATNNLSLTGLFERAISHEKIDAYANAASEKELTSLWGRIKDFFMGTHKEDAKVAIFRLANAETTAEQFNAFCDLNRYVAPEHASALKWNISSLDVLDFQIGDHHFPTRGDTPAFMKECPTLSLEDSCRLLMALTHDGNRVIEGMQHAGIDLSEQLHGALPDEDRLAVQRNVQAMPALVDALQVLGMHRHDDQTMLSVHVMHFVTDTLRDGGTPSRYAERFGDNALALVELASAVKTRD